MFGRTRLFLAAVSACAALIALLLASSRSMPSPAVDDSDRDAARVRRSVTASEQTRLEKSIGAELRPALAVNPPVLPEEAAAKARALLESHGDKVSSIPTLSHWVGEVTAPSDDGWFETGVRSLWIVTFSEVETQKSVPVGSDTNPDTLAQADVAIDSGSGQVLSADLFQVGP